MATAWWEDDTTSTKLSTTSSGVENRVGGAVGGPAATVKAYGSANGCVPVSGRGSHRTTRLPLATMIPDVPPPPPALDGRDGVGDKAVARPTAGGGGGRRRGAARGTITWSGDEAGGGGDVDVGVCRPVTPTSERTVATALEVLSTFTLSTLDSRTTGSHRSRGGKDGGGGHKNRRAVMKVRMERRMQPGGKAPAPSTTASTVESLMPAVVALRVSTEPMPACASGGEAHGAARDTSSTATPVPGAWPCMAFPSEGGAPSPIHHLEDEDDLLPTLDGAVLTATMTTMWKRMSLSIAAGGQYRGAGGAPRASIAASMGRPSGPMPPAHLVRGHITVRPPPGRGAGRASLTAGRWCGGTALPALLPPLEDEDDGDVDDDGDTPLGDPMHCGAGSVPTCASPVTDATVAWPGVAEAMDGGGGGDTAGHAATVLQGVLPTVLAFLPAADLMHRVPAVCKAWHAASVTALAFRISAAPAWVPSTPATCIRASAPPDGHKGGGEGTSAVTSMMVDPPTLTAWGGMLRAFPWGHHLADGGCKTVHRVWVAAARRMEAVSVMDMAALEESGNLTLIQAEIQVGCLLSELVAQGVCPNFVSIYSVFRSAWAPHAHFPSHWGSTSLQPYAPACPFPLPAAARDGSRSMALCASGAPGEANPAAAMVEGHLARLCAKPPHTVSPAGCYLYMRMELCEGGDVEGFLRVLHAASQGASTNSTPSTGRKEVKMGASSLTRLGRGGTNTSMVGGAHGHEATLTTTALNQAAGYVALSLFFQMAYAVYVARDKACLRHHDIKALNFLVSMLPPATSPRTPRGITYCVGQRKVQVMAPAVCHPAIATVWPQLSRVPVVKLADFGTAETGPVKPADPIHSYHFTTWENAPPEYLLLGKGAHQGYACDTWALGLCLLHVANQAGPYEEVMADLHCPPPLVRELVRLWTSHKQYAPVARLLDEFHDEEEDGDDTTACCLADTLYRTLMLTGAISPGSTTGVSPHLASLAATSPVSAVLVDIYRSDASCTPSTAASATTRVGARSKRSKPSTVATGSSGRVEATGRGTRLTPSEVATLRALGVEHGSMYRIHDGALPAWVTVRDRLSPSALALLRSLLDVDPAGRPTGLAMLRHAAFDELEVEAPVRQGDDPWWVDAYATETAAALPPC